MKLPRAQGRPNEFVSVLFSAKAHHCNKVNIFQPSDSSVLRCFVIYLVYHPRKGAKTKFVRAQPGPGQYHPRKGAKTGMAGTYLATTGIPPPQGGENLPFFLVYVVFLDTIPVRGRKRHRLLNRIYNLSAIPVRGQKHDVHSVTLTFLGTIPVRGRKQSTMFLTISLENTIPVRGRKPLVMVYQTQDADTIPVRGQKHGSVRHRVQGEGTIPARGR